MKLINPRGVEVTAPDEWKGEKLNQLLAEGYTLVEEKVEIPTAPNEPIKVKAVVSDYEEVPDLDIELELPEIPEKHIRVLGKNGVLQRLHGHGKYVSRVKWGYTKRGLARKKGNKDGDNS